MGNRQGNAVGPVIGGIATPWRGNIPQLGIWETEGFCSYRAWWISHTDSHGAAVGYGIYLEDCWERRFSLTRNIAKTPATMRYFSANAA